MCRLLLVITVLFVSSQARQVSLNSVIADENARIAGGAPIAIYKRPYVVQVQRDGQLVCGGTLLMSARHVMTAAQCFYKDGTLVDSPSSYNIQVGHAEMHSGTKYDVSKIIMHPDFNPTTLHADIAVVLLSANVTLTQLVQPISIDEGGLNDTSVVLVGWGEPNPPSTLQQVVMGKVGPEECAMRWLNAGVTLNLTGNNVLCVEPSTPFAAAGACAGDAGGPALVDVDPHPVPLEPPNSIAVGVISRLACTSPLFPTVVTRTAPYAGWVEEMVEYYNSSPSSSSGGVLLLLSSFIILKQLQQVL